MQRFDDEAEFAQIVTPHVLDSSASCLPSTQIRLPRATRARPSPATEPDAVTRCVAVADVAGRTSVTGAPSIRKPPGFQPKWRR